MGVSGGMHPPRQPCYQTTFCSTKVPGTPRLCRGTMQHSSCLEDELWERDICSGSKNDRYSPKSKPTVPKREACSRGIVHRT